MAHSQTGQLLLTGVPGTELDSQTAALYRDIQPGGFILFGRNIKTPAQLRKLIDDLRDRIWSIYQTDLQDQMRQQRQSGPIEPIHIDEDDLPF